MASRTNFGHISEPEFAGLMQALSATAKGRSFLAEYRRRSKPDETLDLLGSLRRIEAAITSVRDQLQPQRIAEELLRVGMTLEIAAEDYDSELDKDGVARRFALVERARRELLSLAEGLRGQAEPVSERGEPRAAPIELIEDEHTFLRHLGMEERVSPAER
jgi:hypothetical protein